MKMLDKMEQTADRVSLLFSIASEVKKTIVQGTFCSWIFHGRNAPLYTQIKQYKTICPWQQEGENQ